MPIGIRAKLLAGFYAVALFTAALGWYAASAMERLNAGQRTLYGDVFGGTHLLATWVDTAWEARADMLVYLLVDDPAERTRLRTKLASLDGTLDDLARQMYEANTDREDVQTLAGLTASWKAYSDWRDRSILAGVEPGDRAAAVAAYRTEGVRRQAAIDDAIGEFLDRKREVGATLEAAAEATYELTRRLAVGLAAAAAGLGLLIGFVLARGIADAAGQVAGAARGLARGELDQTIAVRSRDELGQMGEAFREMIAYQQAMAAAADAIARGDLTRDVEPKSARDVLGTAFQRMRANLSALVGELQDTAQRRDEQARLAHERETRSRAVMDSVADGIVTFDADGRIESVNPAAERIFGYGAAELIGASVERLMSEALPGAADGARPATDQPNHRGLVIGDRREVAAWHKDGTRLAVELTVSEVLLDGGCLRIGVVRDITDRKRAEQQRAVQFAVSRVLADSGARDTAISGILHAIGEGFHWEEGAFWSVDPLSEVLQCKAIWLAPHVNAEDFVASSRQTSLRRGVGLPGRVWESRRPLSIADVSQDDNFPRREAAAGAGLRGAFAFPVEGSNDLLGVIEFFSREVRPPDLDLVLTVTAIGQQIGQFVERERAEEAVRESEARKRATLEAALDCIISMDHEGKIIEFNPAAERTFGYDRHEVLGQELAALVIPPSSRAAHRSGLAGYLATGEGPVVGKRLELSALRADGTEFPVELSITLLPTDGPPVFTGFLRDITERKRAEEEIRALNTGLEQRVQERTAQLERLRRQNELILTSAGEGIYGVDRRGRATFVNPVAAALTGHSIPQLLGQSLHDRLRHSGPDGTSYERAACPLCAVLRDGSVRRGAEEVFWRQDGTSFPVEFTSTPIWEQEAIAGAVVTFQDITERRAVEKLKDESVAELTALGEVSRAINSTLDLRAVLTTIVTRAAELSGADAGAIYEFDASTQVFELLAAHGMSDELIAAIRQAPQGLAEPLIRRAAQERRALQISDLRGESVYPLGPILERAGFLAVLCVPLPRDERIVGALIAGRRTPGPFPPATVRLLETFATQSALAVKNARLFQEIEAKSRQLEAANQHKSEFLASMSHELRTPLNAVIGFSDVLLERFFGGLNDKQDEYLRDILGSGRHLLALINDILDLSKVEAGKMELEPALFSLPEALETSLTMVRERAANHAITLALDVSPDIDLVEADERRVKQIVFNLLSNAVKFTPDGGRVEVSARLADTHVEVAVRDTGTGIAAADQERIFDAFQQVGSSSDQSREGTGLGLALTRRFVELHGGRIWVESPVGSGSTFTFSLPLRMGVEPESAAALLPTSCLAPSASRHEVASSAPLILIVEDDARAADLLSLYLTGAGFRVTVARDGEAGLTLARRVRPAAITLDVRLPGLDGWDFLFRAKADPELAAVPVIIVSIVDERGKGIALGAADYLIKPVQRDELLGALRHLIPPGPAPSGRAKVLAIDDDPAAIALVEAVLEPAGYTVVSASGGEEGLALAQREAPALVILDLLMPDVDGFAVVERLRANPATLGIPVIVLTSKDMRPEDKARLNGRISNLARKSEFDPVAFVAMVRGLCPQPVA